MLGIILIVIGFTTIVEVFAFLDPYFDWDFSFFNPVCNYEQWCNMNWFGVIFFTLLINITCPVYALCYWFWKLCTVGRK